MAFLAPRTPEMIELIKALGLPANTVDFTLRVRPDSLVTITCRYRVDDSAIPHIARYLVAVRQDH